MTAGNQGAAYDKAVANLKTDPNNRDLQAEVARTEAALNQSLTRARQKPKS